MKKNFLITGGAGFIGLNFTQMFLKKKFNIVNVDTLSYASNKKEIYKLKKNKKYFFYKNNIGDKKKILSILKKHKILKVINFAAETHVDNSINSPVKFVKNNILDFTNFLLSLNDYYQNLNLKMKKKFKFVHVSTDEVYGSLTKNEKSFLETSSLKPNNPYSATKASDELILRSFNKTYGLPFMITNCSNNYGKYQNDEKLIPTVFRSALRNKIIPIYGNGQNIRDWIHVEDHCRAIYKVLTKGKSTEKYNIGSDNELQNIILVKSICKLLDKYVPKSKSYLNQIKMIKDRPGHDFRYSINSNKIIKLLKWKPKYDFQGGLNQIANFYIKKYLKIK